MSASLDPRPICLCRRKTGEGEERRREEKKAAEIIKKEGKVTRRLLIREVPHLNRV